MLVYEWLNFSDTHVYARIYRMKGYIYSQDSTCTVSHFSYALLIKCKITQKRNMIFLF